MVSCLVGHGNNAGSLLLLQVGDQVPEWPALDVRGLVLDGCRGGHAEEDGVRRAVAHPLGHVVQLVLVKSQPLGDLQVGGARLVLQRIRDPPIPLNQMQLGREQRVLQDKAAVPHLTMIQGFRSGISI